MASTIYLMVGLPASGKSTWSKNHVHDDAEIVSADDIRLQLHGSLIKANIERWRNPTNAVVFAKFHARIVHLLEHGKDVIVDETALTKRARIPIREFADYFGATLHYVLFVNVEEAFQRNSQRPPDKKVPDRVMVKLKEVLYNQTLEEIHLDRFDKIDVVTKHGELAEWLGKHERK